MDAPRVATATACTHCGSDDVSLTQVRSAFWHEDRLVIVEGIPALVCGSCSEQYFDDRTVVALDLLRGVPVFAFGERKRSADSP